ncbi:MAG: PAS domain S-box protein [Methylococcales bacterium]|nr:PAS domain S-box protein [Methylococcales bacterium]
MSEQSSEFPSLSTHQHNNLAEQLIKLNYIINHTPALIGYWDNQLINQFSNDAYSRWFGLTPEEIKGKHIRKVLGDELYHSITFEIEGVLAGKEQSYERFITDANTGKPIHTLTRYLPDISEDSVKGFYVVGVDITDHVSLQDMTLKSDTILDNLTKGVIVTDINNRIIYINPALERITGYSIQDLLGKIYDILQGSNTDRTELQKIKSAINSRQAYQTELLGLRKDGTEFWSEININPIFDRVGNFSQFIYFHNDITNRKRLEAENIASEQRFRSLANAAPVLIWLSGPDKLCYWFNATWLAFTGRTMEQEAGNGWAEGVHPEDLQRCLENYISHFEQRLPFRMEYRLRRFDGEYRWFDDNGVPHFNHLGEFDGYIGSCTDVTDIRNSKAASDFFNISHEIIYSTDLNGIILDANLKFLEITGYNREEVIGKHIKILKSGAQDKSFYTNIWNAINKTGFWSGEITNRNKYGQFYSAITSISTISDNCGHPIRYLAIASDITALVESRDQLKSLAYYDNLTRLPNRALLLDRLGQGMARINREGGYLALLYIDLDGFKQINDIYGHEMGDKVLVTISLRMKNALRNTDTVARMGGDEFIVVLPKFTLQNMVITPVKNLLKACSTPILEQSLTLSITASIGVSLYGRESAQQGLEINTLINQADQAMYKAKQAGKNRYHFHES